MRWGELQSSQKPDVAHGVLSLSRFVFLGAATDLIRRRASPTSGATFCPPATTTGFFGPPVLALVRFPVMSRFTRAPAAEAVLLAPSDAFFRPDPELPQSDLYPAHPRPPSGFSRPLASRGGGN